MTDDIRDKMRAVFLAAIMVLSVVAMTATFAGAAAAQTNDAFIQFDNQESTGDSISITQGDTGDDGAELAIWSVDEDGDPDEVIVSEPVGSNEDLEGAIVDGLDLVDFFDLRDDQISPVDLVAAVHSGGATDENILASDDATVDVVGEAISEEIGSAGAWQGTYWEGQFLIVDAEDAGAAIGDTVQVREVTSFDDGSPSSDRLARELIVNAEGQVIIDTARLRGEGDYVLRHQGEYLDENFAFDQNLQGSIWMELLEQDLSTEFVDDEIRFGQSSDMEVESIRGTFSVDIYGELDGDEVSGDDLAAIFEDGYDGEVRVDLQTGQEFVRVPTGDNQEIEANFSGLDDGDYDFDVEVSDSTAEDSANITVAEEVDEEVTITSPRPGDDAFARGDIIPVELEFQGTDQGVLTFGDTESGQNVEINVSVWDDDESGNATVLINTFQVGNEDRDHGVLPGDDGTAVQVMEDDGHDPHLDLSDGGAGGGAVLAGVSYDLVSVHGDEPHNAENVRRDDRSVVQLEERGTQGFDTWTAPETAEVEGWETVSRLDAGIDAGNVTQANGTIAQDDYLIIEIESTGLEGVLHEALITLEEDGDRFTADQDDRVDAYEALFDDRGEDDDVAEAFFNTDLIAMDNNAPTNPFDPNQMDILSLLTSEGEPDPNVQQYFVLFDEAVDEQDSSVLAGENEDTGSLDRYYVPIQMSVNDVPTATGSVTGPQGNDLTPGDELVSTFSIQAIGPDPTSYPQNVQFVQGETIAGAFFSDELEEVVWDYLPASAQVDGLTEDDVLEVAQQDNVTVSGTTTVAAGTTLAIDFVTVPGEDDPFVKQHQVTVEPGEGGVNYWSVEEDFSNETVGTQFELELERNTGVGGFLTAGGDPVPGVVTAEPAVNEFTFEDRQSGGENIVVQAFNTTQGGFVAIYDDDGERLGTSDQVPRNHDERVNVFLDEDLEDGDHELTAVAYQEEDRPYVEDNETAMRTATISVGEVVPATFEVDNLNPADATIAEGEMLDSVSADVTNTGDDAGSKTVELRLNGDTVDSTQVELEPGDSQTVTFDSVDTSALAPGAYVHSVWTEDGEASGSLTVEEEADAAFDVSLELSTASVEEGGSATATATVENTGDVEGTQTVTITQNGDEVASEEVTLGAGESATVEGDLDTSTPGDYDITASSDDDEVTAQFAVTEEPEPPADDDPDDADDDAAGFGVIVALLAFLAAALLAVRRQVRE